MLEELVTHLLSVDSDEIEVVVVDDHSNDGTMEMLGNIKDKRLHVYYEEVQTGGGGCWFDTFEQGSGEWLFHILDRDWIDIRKIEQLIRVLHVLEEENCGFAVAGEDLSDEEEYKLYAEGLETINQFGLRHSHPTGQIFYRKAWSEIADKKKYFVDEKYGVYPHGYIYAIMGNTRKGAYLLFDISDRAHYQQRVIRTISKAYVLKEEKTEWFWPQSRFKLLRLACENIDLVSDKSLHANIILEKYITFFFCVTREWYANCHNEILKMRYSRPEMSTNYIELLTNGFDYITLFREYLEEQGFWWADTSFYKALCDVDNQLTAWLLKWTEEIRIRERST
ncbi:MAG: glycosyltransferase [Acetatifactor sp.]|nr:glycosyltransferase [Acetatifactor sp.]